MHVTASFAIVDLGKTLKSQNISSGDELLVLYPGGQSSSVEERVVLYPGGESSSVEELLVLYPGGESSSFNDFDLFTSSFRFAPILPHH